MTSKTQNIDISTFIGVLHHTWHTAHCSIIITFRLGIFATTASVVKNIAATLAACCKAERVTLVGSTIPSSSIFTHSFVAALNPTPASACLSLSTITEPSNPAFSAI